MRGAYSIESPKSLRDRRIGARNAGMDRIEELAGGFEMRPRAGGFRIEAVGANGEERDIGGGEDVQDQLWDHKKVRMIAAGESEER
jgi:hypothetical protein